MRYRSAPAGLLLICCALLFPAASQAVPTPAANPPSTLVKNINTALRNDSPAANYVYYTTTIGNHAYFVDYDHNNGQELWISDGTAAGTHMVRDINPGPSDGSPANLVAVGQTLFFTAGVPGSFSGWLWKSDGTTAGTVPVTESENGKPVAGSGLFSVGNTLYFRSGENTLWKSDNITGETMLLQVWPGYNQIGNYTELNGTLFFFRLQADQSMELWQSDGTPAGTQLVKTVGTNSLTLTEEYAVVGNRLYFMVGSALWRSDGTSAGTQQILTLNSFAGDLEAYAGMLYYRANYDIIQADPLQPPETHTGLLRLANSSTTPEVVYDFGVGALGVPLRMDNIGGKLYFIGPGFQIWSSDGTTTAAVLATDGQPIKDTRNFLPIKPRMVALNNGTVILSATRDMFASPILYDLWAIPGVTGIAQRAQQFDALQGEEPASFASIGETVLFAAGAVGQNGNRALWRTDGSEPGTHALTSRLIEQGIDGPSAFPSPQLAQVALNNRILFNVAVDAGQELWVSNGTASGTTQLLTDTHNLGVSSFLEWQGAGYFLAPTGVGTGFWRTDGTAAGTQPLASVAAPTFIYALVKTTQSLYFIAGTRAATTNASGDMQLWKSDGTLSGTVPAASLPSYRSFNDSGYPGVPEVVGNRLFFTATEQASGRELWVSDGTQIGTHMTKDIGLAENSPNLIGLTAVGERLFFLEGFSTYSGYNLWVSDGSEAGTTIAKALGSIPLGQSSVNGQMIDLNGQAFFSGWDTQAWIEPWISNGTEAGTQRIKDINQTQSFIGPQLTNSSLPYNMVTINRKALFSATDGIHGNELWISDGTEAGTSLLIDLNPGMVGSAPTEVTSFGGFALFAASSGPDGIEVWKTDGTAAGTIRLADVAAGPGSSNPGGFRLAGTTLFFLADDGMTGRELHALELAFPYRVFLPGVIR